VVAHNICTMKMIHALSFFASWIITKRVVQSDTKHHMAPLTYTTPAIIRTMSSSIESNITQDATNERVDRPSRTNEARSSFGKAVSFHWIANKPQTTEHSQQSGAQPNAKANAIPAPSLNGPNIISSRSTIMVSDIISNSNGNLLERNTRLFRIGK